MLFKSEETGDFITACIIPPECIISGRSRETGAIEHEDDNASYTSALEEFPALCWFAKGRRSRVLRPGAAQRTRANGAEDRWTVDGEATIATTGVAASSRTKQSSWLCGCLDSR